MKPRLLRMFALTIGFACSFVGGHLKGGTLSEDAKSYNVKSPEALIGRVRSALAAEWVEQRKGDTTVLIPANGYNILVVSYLLSEELMGHTSMHAYGDVLDTWSKIFVDDAPSELSVIPLESLESHNKQLDKELASWPGESKDVAKRTLTDAIKVGADLSNTNQPKSTFWGVLRVKKNNYLFYVPIGVTLKGNYVFLMKIKQ